MSGRARLSDNAAVVPSYVVVGVLADGRDVHGAVVTMHRGSPVPPSITPESVQHLISVGLVAESQS